jgi:hypothetical protein
MDLKMLSQPNLGLSEKDQFKAGEMLNQLLVNFRVGRKFI